MVQFIFQQKGDISIVPKENTILANYPTMAKISKCEYPEKLKIDRRRPEMIKKIERWSEKFRLLSDPICFSKKWGNNRSF